MGKLQIGPTTVNIKVRAQQLTAHRRAFDVPARTAGSIARSPDRINGFVCFGSFPEYKIQRIAFVTPHGHALTGPQFIDGLARQCPVTGELPNRKMHIARLTLLVGILIGIPIGDQSIDHGEHLRHVGSGSGLMRRWQHPQSLGIFLHGLNKPVGQRRDGFVVLNRPGNDLVVNVGDVTDIGDPIACSLKPSTNHVKDHQDPRVTHMAVVVDGHTTDVQADMPRFYGQEICLLTG